MRISYWSADVCSSDLWKLFVDAEKPGWAGPELASLAQRAAQIDTVYGKLAETFLERTTQEWMELLRELGIHAAPLRSARTRVGRGKSVTSRVALGVHRHINKQ